MARGQRLGRPPIQDGLRLGTLLGAEMNQMLFAHAARSTSGRAGQRVIVARSAPSDNIAVSGNFSVNQYSRIEIGTAEARLVYVLDLAELPTVADRPLLDSDGDGAIAGAERASYLDGKLSEIAPALHLFAGSTELDLRPTAQSLALVTRSGRARHDPHRSHLRRRPSLDRRRRGTADLPQRLRERPPWLAGDRRRQRPRRQHRHISSARRRPIRRAARLSRRPALQPPRRADGHRRLPALARRSRRRAESARRPRQVRRASASAWRRSSAAGRLSTGGLLLALLAAAGWGAVHALSPGHGKTVVGAYLVGSRGTPRHALFLGLTVTITHTAGVIALGLVILFASRTVMPEQLYPWLSLVSGLLVAVLGLTILRQRLMGLPRLRPSSITTTTTTMTTTMITAHDHAHAHAHGLPHSHDGHVHSHLPPGADGERLTWRGLLALGISGGLLPCPSALLALLGAVAVGRAGFGLLVVVAFSLGLAATLTGVGLLFLYAGRFLERRALAGRWSGLLQFAPPIAAVAVTASGVMIVARALAELQRL